jgi:hypothetical protein
MWGKCTPHDPGAHVVGAGSRYCPCGILGRESWWARQLPKKASGVWDYRLDLCHLASRGWGPPPLHPACRLYFQCSIPVLWCENLSSHGPPSWLGCKGLSLVCMWSGQSWGWTVPVPPIFKSVSTHLRNIWCRGSRSCSWSHWNKLVQLFLSALSRSVHHHLVICSASKMFHLIPPSYPH